MSQFVDEYYSVYRETLRCARKQHKCDACDEPIETGHLYYTVTWVFDGSADGVKRCLKCQKIHKHLRAISDGDTWPSEKLDCGEEYEDHWGVKPPDEIARLAFMPADEAQQELAPKKDSIAQAGES